MSERVGGAEGELPSALIDTSIQFVRLLYRRDQQLAAEACVEEYVPHLSQTVYREFFVGLVPAFRFVSSVLAERPNQSARSAMADLSRAMADFRGSDRERQKLLLVMALMQEVSTDDTKADDLAVYAMGELRRLQEYGFYVFGTSYARRRDVRETGSFLAPLGCSVADDLVDVGRVRPSCNADTRTCHLRSALGGIKGDLVPLAEALRESRERHRDRLLQIAAKPDDWFARGPRAVGQRLCWPIGDTLISLECPDGCRILTTDRDFEASREVLGRDVEVLQF